MVTQNPNRFYNLAVKGGLPSNIRPAPFCVFQQTLAATTNVSITVPTYTKTGDSGQTQQNRANFVLFSATNNFWAKPSTTSTGTAAMTDETTNGTASELNPASWGLDLQPDGSAPILSFGIIAPNAATIVTMSFYAQD